MDVSSNSTNEVSTCVDVKSGRLVQLLLLPYIEKAMVIVKMDLRYFGWKSLSAYHVTLHL